MFPVGGRNQITHPAVGNFMCNNVDSTSITCFNIVSLCELYSFAHCLSLLFFFFTCQEGWGNKGQTRILLPFIISCLFCSLFFNYLHTTIGERRWQHQKVITPPFIRGQQTFACSNEFFCILFIWLH